MKPYVILGNGVAAVACVEGIRKVDKETPVVIVSAEERPVYCRPLISYYLEGKTDPQKMNYRGPDFYVTNSCEVLYGRKGVKLDANAKVVALDDGSVLEYRALCVATGASPFTPDVKGLDSVKCKTNFLTLDDAFELESYLDSTTRVLILGAGLIGLKCAEGVCHRVAETIVCNRSPQVLTSILEPDCAAIVQKQMEEEGVKFILGDFVDEFQGNKAILKSGRKVDFDVLVLAVGVRPNVQFAADAGVQVDRGILVDSSLQTNLPDVYASGDCSQGEDQSLDGKKRVLAIMPNAYMQGRAAGVNMAGGKELFEKGIPMNSLGFFGLHVMTAGRYDGEIYEEKSDRKLKRLFTRDGLLVGFILIGETDRAGVYTALIREKTPLSTVDFESLKRVAASTALGKDARKHSFGGLV